MKKKRDKNRNESDENCEEREGKKKIMQKGKGKNVI